uniref:Sphingosine-1-phosphate receptor 4 n=2 Tax=Latimeria chalumnae TaxID=7897 RepID=H3B4Y4_LATCH
HNQTQSSMDLMDDMNFCLESLAFQNINIILLQYNRTGKLQNRHPHEEDMGGTKALFIAISCFIMLENLLVLFAILCNTKFRSWVYYCIANVTLSDLLIGAAYIINLCMSGRKTFQLTSTMWFFREGVLFVALAASTFSLLITAFERYITMIKSIHYIDSRKTYRVYGLICLCWVMAFVIGLLPLLGWNCICDFQNCSTLLPLYSKNYILFCVIVFSLLLIGIVALYVAIYHLVSTSAKTVPSSRNRQKSLRLLKTVCLIVGAFIICWSPLFILLLLDVFCESRSCSLLHNMEWAIVFAVLNSAINPMIYSCGSMEMRKAIFQVLCCCCIEAGVLGPFKFLLIAESSGRTSTDSLHRIRESFRSSRALSVRSDESVKGVVEADSK